VKALTALCAALALSTTGTSCGIDTSTASDAPTPGRDSNADCQATDPYSDIEALAADIARAPSIVGLAGGDMAVDTALSDGDLLMAFGDTILDSPLTQERMVRNAVLAFGGDRTCLVLGPGGSAFIPDRSDGVGYWPTSLTEVAPGTVAMFAQRVADRRDDRFVNLGPGLAEVHVDDGIPHVVRVIEIGPDDPSRQRIGWGAGVWRADDGFIYIYGTANPERDLVFGWSLHVARVAPDRIFDTGSWEYWVGTGWSPDATRAVEIIPAVGGVEQTLSVFAIDQEWYAVSKRDGYLGDAVVIRSAPSPTGPFTAGEVVAVRPSYPEAGILRYAALAHPALFPEPGTIVLSVSNNATDAEAVSADPTLYRPEFFRVPLP
jgi:hypothetical protein